MKLFPVLLLALLVSPTLGCKGGKNQQASTPAPTTPTPIVIVDADKDGIADAEDPDDDNDGVVDAQDRFPFDPNEMRDSDGDNQGDKADLDDDNDGLADTLDAYPLDAKEQKDSDNDGTGDNFDTDDDNDGIADSADRFPLSNLEAADADGDGLGNNADPDDDNDGVADGQDALPFNPKETSDIDKDGIGDKEDLDNDNDGVADSADKFPLDGKESKDADGDGVGDIADTDDDNDGAPDVADAQPLNPKEQLDTDGDGMGNNQDDDDDNDTVVDAKDKFPLDAKETADYDADGIGNNADTDDDNDGIADVDDKVLGIIKVSSANIEDASKLKVASSGAIAYVINSANKTLTSIEVATGATIKSITLTDSPNSIALSPDNSRIFVTTSSSVTTDFWTSNSYKLQTFAAADFSKIAEIYMYDPSSTLCATSNQQVISTPLNSYYGQLYDLTNGFQGYAIDSGGVNLFDAERGYLYSAYGNRLSKNLRSGNSFSAAKSNLTLTFAADDQLWLNAGGSFLLSSTGQIFNTDTLNKSNQLELAGAKITGVYVDAINALAYLALSTGSLAIVNADTFDLIQIQPVATTPLVGVSVVGQKLISLTRNETGALSIISQAYDCPACYLNAAPKAVATADNAEPKTGQTVVFDAAGTSDPEQDKLQYRWDFDGDGNWDTQLSATAKASFQYGLPGAYSARLQVFDSKGASAQAVLAINVQVSAEKPIARDVASDIFDFPVTKGIFDGVDTVYYLDENTKRVYLVSLASGRAERYFQFDYPVKQIFNSADLSKIYVVQHAGSQKIKTMVAAIDTAKQMIDSAIVLNEQFARFMYVDAGHFLAAANNYVVVDSKTGAVSALSGTNQFYSLFTNEAGNIYGSGSYSLSRLVLRGSELVVDKPLVENIYLDAFGSAPYVSRDESLEVSGTFILPLKNPGDRYNLADSAIKVVGDPNRNVVFVITATGAVEVINTSSGQKIQRIDLGRAIRDVIVKGDQLYLVLEQNTQQSTLISYAHPCLSCKAGQTVAVDLNIAPANNQAGKPVTFSVTSTLDTAINNWLFRWDLNGDGTWDGPFAPGDSVQTNYVIAGLKIVSGQAKNELGDIGSATEVFEVAPGESVAQTASNTTVAGRFGSQSIVAGVQSSGLFLVADQVSRKLYFYDVLLDQITKELNLEMLPEAIKISPDNSTAYIQLVDRQQSNFGGSVNERRYVIRIELSNYTATHSFILPTTGGSLALALNSDRILLSNLLSDESSLVDSRNGAVLATLSGIAVNGPRAIINNRIYLSLGSLIDFSGDKLTLHVFSGFSSGNDSPTWALPGNHYVIDAQGNKLDLTASQVAGGQGAPWNYSFERVDFDPQGHFGYLINYSEIIFFNLETLQVIRAVPSNDARAALISNGQLFTFGLAPSVRRLQEICGECIGNLKPVANLTVPAGPLDTSKPIALDASASTDPEGAQLIFRWDFDNDGAWDTDFSDSPIQSKNFPVAGKFYVRVQIRDVGGQLADAQVSFDVEQAPDYGSAVKSTQPYIFIGRPVDQLVDEANGYLYYANQDLSRLYVMSLTNGFVERFFQFEGSPQTLSLSPDKKLLYLSATDNSAGHSTQSSNTLVFAIDLTSRAIIHSMRVNHQVYGIKPLNGKRIFTTDNNGKISLYSVESGQRLADFPQFSGVLLRDVLDESSVLTYQRSNGHLAKSHFDLESMQVTTEEILNFNGFGEDRYWISPDKTRIVFSDGSIYSLKDFSLQAKIPVTGAISSIAFASDSMLYWVDYDANSRVNEYNVTMATNVAGVICNCSAIFAYAGHAWAINRYASDVHYSTKLN